MFTSALLRGYTDFIVPIVTTGSFRKDNSDGNENVTRQVVGLYSTTITLHVRDAFCTCLYRRYSTTT